MSNVAARSSPVTYGSWQRLAVAAVAAVGGAAQEQALRAGALRGRVPERVAKGEVELVELDADDAGHHPASRRANHAARIVQKGLALAAELEDVTRAGVRADLLLRGDAREQTPVARVVADDVVPRDRHQQRGAQGVGRPGQLAPRAPDLVEQPRRHRPQGEGVFADELHERFELAELVRRHRDGHAGGTPPEHAPQDPRLVPWRQVGQRVQRRRREHQAGDPRGPMQRRVEQRDDRAEAMTEDVDGVVTAPPEGVIGHRVDLGEQTFEAQSNLGVSVADAGAAAVESVDRQPELGDATG